MPDIAHLGIQVDSGSAQVAVTNLNALVPAAARAEGAVEALGTASQGAAGQVATVGQAAQESAQRAGNAASLWDRLGAAIVRAGEAAQRGNYPIYDAGRRVQAAGDAAEKATGGMRNFALQMNQVGQVAMITGNPLQALIVQLPDLAVGLNPVAMGLTVAAAMAVQFGYNMYSAEEAAVDFEDATEGLTSALERYNNWADIATRSSLSLREEFGANAEAARAYAEVMTRLAANEILQQLRGAESAFTQGLQEALNALEAREGALQGAIATAEQFRGQTSGNANSARDAMAAGLTDARNAANEAAAAIGLTTSEVEQLDRAFKGMQAATTMEDLGRATQSAMSLITELYRDAGPNADTSGLSDIFQLIFDLNATLMQQLPGLRSELNATGTAINTGFIGPMQAGLPELLRLMGEALEEGDVERWGRLGANMMNTAQHTADFKSRIDEMQAPLEHIVELAEAGYGGPQMQALAEAAQAMLEPLNEAEENIALMTEADMSNLESGFSSLATFAGSIAASVGVIVDGLNTPFNKSMDAYQQYQGSRANDQLTRNMAAERGILELIRVAEGTQGEGKDLYNETLDYGRWTGGDVNLTGMTLRQVRELQSRMRTPENRRIHGDGGSSAVGAYQIVGQTLEGLIRDMHLTGNEYFTPELQDRMALELIRQNGGGVSAVQSQWEALTGENPALIARALAVGGRSPGAPLGQDPAIDNPNAPGGPPARGIDWAPEYTGTRPELRPNLVDEGFLGAQEDALKERLEEGVEARDEYNDRLEDSQKAIDRLVASYNPAIDATQQIEQAQLDLAEAVKLGQLEQREADAILNDFTMHVVTSMPQIEEAIKAAAEAAEEQKEAFIGAFTDIGDAMAQVLVYGESWREQFGNLLRQAAAQLVSSGFSSLIQTGFNAMFPGAGVGPGTSSLLPGDNYAGGGYTGAGPRVGGLDGQGGRLAMIHPDETVIDHKAGGAMGGGRQSYEINVNGATTNAELREMVEAGIQQAFAAENKGMPDRMQYIARHHRDR